jgi:transposase InsO family protein
MSSPPFMHAFPPGHKPLLSKHQRWRAVAKALRLSKAAKLRLEWMIYYDQKQSAALTLRHFGLSGKVFYTWKNRFDTTDLTGLEDRSKRPKTLRTKQYTSGQVQEVQQLRRLYPTLGRAKLAILYREHHNKDIPDWYLRRIICDYRLYATRAVKNNYRRGRVRGRPKKRLSELTRKAVPGHVVEVDAIVIYFTNVKRYIFTAIDLHTRVGYARMYKTKASAGTADFLRRLTYLLDGQLQNLHVDNGSEFAGAFLEAAGELKLGVYHARPYTPEDKPFIERFNGILQQEFADLGNLTDDLTIFNRDLTEWLIFYNFVRPHHSLGLKRPAEFANMVGARVLPMYSPMTLC